MDYPDPCSPRYHAPWFQDKSAIVGPMMRGQGFEQMVQPKSDRAVLESH